LVGDYLMGGGFRVKPGMTKGGRMVMIVILNLIQDLKRGSGSSPE
jgi:hypothetical protein